MIKYYLQIIKPGIVVGNLIAMTGGFFLASKGIIHYNLFIMTFISVLFIISSGCVFNNCIDRDIDSKIIRNKHRVLVKRLIPLKNALIYAVILNIIGFTCLYFFINLLVIWLATIGFIVYVIIYSLYIKRKSVYSTLIGSVSGAMPPVIGYCSVSNKIDTGAIILFFMFAIWQIPHAYAIAIFRYDDYQTALIPVLPATRGIALTKHHIMIYIIGFMMLSTLLTLYGYTGYIYLSISIIMNILWIILACKGYQLAVDNIAWAYKLFIFSIINMVTISILMSIDYIH